MNRFHIRNPSQPVIYEHGKAHYPIGSNKGNQSSLAIIEGSGTLAMERDLNMYAPNWKR